MPKNIMDNVNRKEPDCYKIPPPPQSCTECGCDTRGQNNSVTLLSLIDSRTGQASIKPSGASGCTYHHDRFGNLMGLTPPPRLEFDRWLNQCANCYRVKSIDKYSEQKRQAIAKSGMTRIPGEDSRSYANRCKEFVFQNMSKIGVKL